MLELADDAADVIENLFENFSWESINIGNQDTINLVFKDGEKIEAKITGSIKVSAETGSFGITTNLNCTEFEDDGETKEKEFTLDISLNFKYDLSSFNQSTKIEDLIKYLDDSISIKINGKDVWKEAFLAELD